MTAALCYYGCFLALGLAIAALGPSLLALANNTGSTVHLSVTYVVSWWQERRCDDCG